VIDSNRSACRRRCHVARQSSSATVCPLSAHSTQESSDAIDADMSSDFHGRVVTVFPFAANDVDEKRQIMRPWSLVRDNVRLLNGAKSIG